MSSSFKGTDSYKDGGGGSGLDQLVKVNASDASANFLDKKITEGENIQIQTVSDLNGNLQMRISGIGSGSSSFKHATFNEMIADTIAQIRQDGSIDGTLGNGASNGTRAFSWIAPLDMQITQMGASFRQIALQPWRFVIYDENRQLLSSTARFTPALGYNVVNMQTMVSLQANQRIYVGYWAGDSDGNTKLELIGGCLKDNTSPLIQISSQNEAPTTMGTGLGQTGFRPWLTFGN
jgi:hypothetical protein